MKNWEPVGTRERIANKSYEEYAQASLTPSSFANNHFVRQGPSP